MTRIALLALAVALVALARRRRPPEPDPYAEPVPMTWAMPVGYTATYRYTVGPTGVPSSLN